MSVEQSLLKQNIVKFQQLVQNSPKIEFAF